MKTVIKRIKTIKDKPYWFTTHSIEKSNYGLGLCHWANTMYLHFCKDEFPDLPYPKLEDHRFDYMNCGLYYLPFHGGITFYEETKNIESGRTFVKVGCDYQHLYDELDWGMEDSGERILRDETPRVAKAFEEMI